MLLCWRLSACPRDPLKSGRIYVATKLWRCGHVTLSPVERSVQQLVFDWNFTEIYEICVAADLLLIGHTHKMHTRWFFSNGVRSSKTCNLRLHVERYSYWKVQFVAWAIGECFGWQWNRTNVGISHTHLYKSESLELKRINDLGWHKKQANFASFRFATSRIIVFTSSSYGDAFSAYCLLFVCSCSFWSYPFVFVPKAISGNQLAFINRATKI